MLVMKFGGTSVGDSEAFRRVAEIVRTRLKKRPIIVVSATAKTTDELVSFAKNTTTRRLHDTQGLAQWIIEKHEKLASDLGIEEDQQVTGILGEASEQLNQLCKRLETSGPLTEPEMDECLSIGEFLSCNLLAAFLRKCSVKAAWIDAREVVKTDSRFGKARPHLESSEQRAMQILKPAIDEGTVPVLQGFVGSNPDGKTTTLGRGGSDYSATFIGAILGAEKVEIWTDVDGILTADPSLVPTAKLISHMTSEEAAELAYFGAKVLHPSTIRPAVDRGIPVNVLNSMRPAEPGTEIVLPKSKERGKTTSRIKSIAYKERLSVLNIRSNRMLMVYGFLSSIFEIFNRFETAVDLVTTSEVSVSVTVDNLKNLPQIVDALSEFAEVELRHGKSIVCCVGEDICREPGMPAQIFSELEGIEVTLISQGASRINISFVIADEDLPEVINRLHNKFFPEVSE